jgi:4-alpha-glucanotransferase
MPIYVSASSCDTWVHRNLFDLDERGHMRKTGGVPPDAFTEDGQNWRNPVFLWEANRRQGYRWWIERFRRNLRLYDFLRLDHFRGFEACFEIPAGAKTARDGNWRKGPGKALFEAAEAVLGPLPILAEDLGVITAGVHDLRNTFAWPGMKVYQFHADEMLAADGTEEADADAMAREGEAGGSDAAPTANGAAAKAEAGAEKARATSLQVFYTGTHDNDTLASWVFERMRAEGQASRIGPANASSDRVREVCAEIVGRLYATSALWVILPLQDVWFLDTDARMNTPGVAEGNWVWTASEDAFTRESAAWLRGLADRYGRLG